MESKSSLQTKTEQLESFSELHEVSNKNLNTQLKTVGEPTSKECGNVSKRPLLDCVDWSIFKSFTVIIVVIYTGITVAG